MTIQDIPKIMYILALIAFVMSYIYVCSKMMGENEDGRQKN